MSGSVISPNVDALTVAPEAVALLFPSLETERVRIREPSSTSPPRSSIWAVREAGIEKVADVTRRSEP